ncbi:hypothetical protein C8R46DRAFT_1094694 [Mycena filopes]|nr:hypothetical protein C8R46DRAFT_1094694 [Mycena filopes]
MDVVATCPCDTTCSIHFSFSKKDVLPPPTPYPQLLPSSAGPPTDSQATVLRAEIECTEAAISIADSHLRRLRSALEQLLRYREDLESAVATHRGVLSALRRLPNEILVEIFQYTIIPSGSAFRRAPWVMSHVSSHWRAVAIGSPMLWRYITAGRVRDAVFAANLLLLQVQRVRVGKVRSDRTRFPRGRLSGMVR